MKTTNINSYFAAFSAVNSKTAYYFLKRHSDLKGSPHELFNIRHLIPLQSNSSFKKQNKTNSLPQHTPDPLF